MTHREHGQVYWPGKIDVRNVQIDRVVRFTRKNLKVYPDLSDLPPVGEGLNQPCRVTLYKIAPDRDRHELGVDKPGAEFVTLLQQICETQRSKYVTYREQRQEWVFDMQHW